MQEDFHYYATYCASYLAGYSHEECQIICYSANLVDLFTAAFIDKIGGPKAAATTQPSMELADAHTDIVGLQNITRIWASFHFLPYDLYAEVNKGSKYYKQKYRLICDTNSDLLVDTVNLAKDSSLQAIGIAMHVLADTWAHRYFAGTPSLVINNIGKHFYELIDEEGTVTERKVDFRHSLGKADDLEKGIYTSSMMQIGENAIMNLGHGRAGHLPDYSFIRYKYLPAWADYREFIKDNPSDYWNAFCQMIYALKFLRGVNPVFEKEQYDTETAAPYEAEIHRILKKRQLIAIDDWKALGEQLSGESIEPFDQMRYQAEYMNADKNEKEDTFLGRFIMAALSQKSMVTNRIYNSGNKLAGISIDYDEKGLKGMRDFFMLEKKRKGQSE